MTAVRAPHLSVVIPTLGRREILQRTLESLAQQTLPAPEYEVIAAVDGSRDGTVAMLAELGPRLPYRLIALDGPGNGPGAARNHGALAARGDLLLFLDDDILATPPLLAEHLAGHTAGEASVILGQVRLWPGARLSAWETYLAERYEQHYDKLAQPGYVLDFWDCLSGNVSISRELFARSTGFDSAFGASKHDDIEWGYRLAGLAAHFAYRPAALGYHQFVKPVAAGLRDAFTDGWSSVRLARRYPSLRARLLTGRWARQPAWRLGLARWLLAAPGRLSVAAAVASRALRASLVVPLPGRLRRAIHRAAYHTQFWLGVREESTADEWRALLGTLQAP